VEQSPARRLVIESFRTTFVAQSKLADGAIAQLGDSDLHIALSEPTNSIAAIMQHVAGNLRSRFTDFLTSDGEKPWRDRDSEFLDQRVAREELLALWEGGWSVLFATLSGLSDSDLEKVVTIRGEPHSVALALSRSLAHMGYHAGQIVQAGRVLADRAGTDWKTLTVARGGTQELHQRMGFEPTERG
jgi:uncharacterized damage-inducible protein DinB